MAAPPANRKRKVEVVVVTVSPTITPMVANAVGVVKSVAVTPTARPVAMVVITIPRPGAFAPTLVVAIAAVSAASIRDIAIAIGVTIAVEIPITVWTAIAAPDVARISVATRGVAKIAIHVFTIRLLYTAGDIRSTLILGTPAECSAV
jgi:hypothetical protein